MRISRITGEALDRAKDFADPVEPGVAGPVRPGRPHHGLQPHPPSGDPDETEPARRRLAFDELFRLQLALVLRQARLQRDARGIRHVVDGADGDEGSRAATRRRWWSSSSSACPSR